MTLLAFQKSLALLVMPVGFVWLMMIVASVWCWRRRQRGPALLLTGTTLVLTCIGNSSVSHALMASLEDRIPQIDLERIEPFDAVFVLGAGSAQDCREQPMLSPCGDRIAQAARLWRAGKTAVLVASGTCRSATGQLRNCGLETCALWRDMGVPDHVMMTISEPCWITREEIAAYHKLTKERGWKRVAVVSSAYHLPRAMALADAIGFHMTPIGADWRSAKQQPGSFLHIIPNAACIYDCQSACWEYVGRWVGR